MDNNNSFVTGSENESGYEKPTETMYCDGWCIIRRWKWITSGPSSVNSIYARRSLLLVILEQYLDFEISHACYLTGFIFVLSSFQPRFLCGVCVYCQQFSAISIRLTTIAQAAIVCESCTIVRMCNYWISFPWWKSWFSMHWFSMHDCENRQKKCGRTVCFWSGSYGFRCSCL